MTQAASARAEAPTQRHNTQTYFLAVDDVFELKIAQAYVRATYPESQAKVVRELPMHRLPRSAVVIPVTRGEDRTAAWSQEFHGNSVRPVHLDPKSLSGQIREAKPIPIEDHWRAVADEFDAFGGELNRDAFLDALSARSTPAVARVHIGNPSIVRLAFI